MFFLRKSISYFLHYITKAITTSQRSHINFYRNELRYYVEAKLDRKGFFTFDKKKKEFITINALMDLNQMPSIIEPVTVSDSKTFGCLCCKSGPLSSTVNVPRVGYAPGEGIPIFAEVENLSDKVMNKTNAKLIQKIVFHSDSGKSKKIERTIQVCYIVESQ